MLTTEKTPVQHYEESLLSQVMTPGETMGQMQRVIRHLSPARLAAMSRLTTDLSHCRFVSDAHEGAIGAAQVVPEPVVSQSLPAVISRALRAADISHVRWADLSSLPGMADASIRALGNQIFSHFGLVSGAPVKVVSAFDDADMLNATMEVNAVLHFLEHAALKCSPDNMRMTFGGALKSYSPEVRLYHTANHAYLAVLEQDIGGRYIYAFARQQQLSQPDR